MISDSDQVYCHDCARFYGYQAECPSCQARIENEQALRHRLQIITYSRRASWVMVGILIGVVILLWP